ncbi:MAG: 30S ribosomal protein S4e [Methanomassiliicoccales archaeon]
MTRDMKRLTAPRSWPVPRKVAHWIAKPSPGPHGVEESMPLVVVLRDILKVADTAKEVKRILRNRDVLVDGRVVTDHEFPLGLMDVLSIPKLGQHYRMMLDRNGKFRPVKVPEGKHTWKLCRIEGKTTVSGGRTQLNLHDGRNLLVSKDVYKVGDVLKLEVPSQKILDTYKLAKGSTALITSGSNVGQLEVVEEYIVQRTVAPNLVKFRDGKVTIKDNVFVVGSKAPEVELPEASVL